MNNRSEWRARLDYLDFELEIAPGDGQLYPASVIRSPAGEAHSTMRFPFEELELQNHLLTLQIALLRSGGQRRQILSPEEQTVRDFGQALFDALFSGEVRSRYDVSLERSLHEEKGLRIKLRIKSSELAVLPWEYLYDSRNSEYVCLSYNTPVVRYLELAQSVQPLGVQLPVRILGMATSPHDLLPLDIEHEKKCLETAVADLQSRCMVELTWLEGQTWRDLQRQMRRGPWHVFHFIGHGSFDRDADEGLVAFTEESGHARYITATHLGRLLADHLSLRLVFLNSCEGARGSEHDLFSSTAAILVRRGLPSVLAMQYAITDCAAIEFSRSFYEALADGMPVDAAAAEGRKAISLSIPNTVEWGTPALYMRAPDGKLFDIHRQAFREPVSPSKKDRLLSDLLEKNASEVVLKADYSKKDLEEFIRDRFQQAHLRITTLEAYIMQGWTNRDLFDDLTYDPDPQIRQGILRCVYRNPNPDNEVELDEEQIERLLKDSEQKVVVSAVKATGRLVKKGTVPASLLTVVKNHPYWLVRKIAIEHIADLDSSIGLSLLYEFRKTSYHVSQQLIRDYIEEHFSQGDFGERQHQIAVEILEQLSQAKRVSRISKEKNLKLLAKLQSEVNISLEPSEEEGQDGINTT